MGAQPSPKATPRGWLREGEHIQADSVPSSHGRISFTISSAIDSSRVVRLNVTAPAAWAQGRLEGPPGGLYIRARTPKRSTIVGVTVGGSPWEGFDSTQETLHFPPAAMTRQLLDGLAAVEIRYAH